MDDAEQAAVTQLMMLVLRAINFGIASSCLTMRFLVGWHGCDVRVSRVKSILGGDWFIVAVAGFEGRLLTACCSLLSYNTPLSSYGGFCVRCEGALSLAHLVISEIFDLFLSNGSFSTW